MSKELSTKVWAKCATGKPEPAAYQIRLSTSKGVVQVAPDIEDKAPNDERIQITQSMLKAKQKDNVKARLGGRMTILDAAHYVACVVKSATCRYPARLSFQLIPILCEQGVPLSAIKGLQKRTVDATINDLRIPPQGTQDGNMAFPKAIQRYANLVYNTLLESGEGSPKEKEAWKQEKKWRLDELISSLETEDGNVGHADMVLCRNAQLYLAATSGLNIRSSAYFMEIWKNLIEKAVRSATMSFKIEVPGSVYCTIVPGAVICICEG
jgi:RNA dependent RNA polymerase